MAYGREIRVAFVQWPEGLLVGTPAWTKLCKLVQSVGPDLLVTNELPFGNWLAGFQTFSLNAAHMAIEQHASGLDALAKLDIPAIVSTRPVLVSGQLLNQTYALVDGHVRILHTKQVFANEAGWYEDQWFTGNDAGFEVSDILGLKIGVLLGAEAMYSEHARRYGRQGAELIVVPRSAGRDIGRWKAACSMAAVVSGCYVISSNRFGHSEASPRFGGAGLAFAPSGKFLKATANDCLIQTVVINRTEVAEAQSGYPCTLPEYV